jgi:DNA-binding NarL/FixJ family response regulator
VWVTAVGVALVIIGRAVSPPLHMEWVENPTGLAVSEGHPLYDGVAGWLLLFVGLLAAVASFVVRFRRSRPEQRRQLNWLVLAAVLAALGVLATAFSLLLGGESEVAELLVVVALRMPPGNHMEGINAAHTIRARHPGVGVVVLSQHADEAYAFALLKDGTAGLAYLLKDRVGDLDTLLRALREVCAGGSVIDPMVVEALLDRRARLAGSRLENLTPRETDVLRAMAQGCTNAAIADTLVLSRSAVEKHVSSIFAKLGLTEETRVDRRVTAVLTLLRDSGIHGPTVDR